MKINLKVKQRSQIEYAQKKHKVDVEKINQTDQIRLDGKVSKDQMRGADPRS